MGVEADADLVDLALDIFLGLALLLLVVAGHDAVELPAHLSEGLLLSKRPTLLVHVLQLHLVVLLVVLVSEGLEDLRSSLVFVASKELSLA